MGGGIGTGVVGLTIGVGTGAGTWLKGKVTVAVEGGKDLGTESLRLQEPRRCEGGNNRLNSSRNIGTRKISKTIQQMGSLVMSRKW